MPVRHTVSKRSRKVHTDVNRLWSLPGGPRKIDESCEETALRTVEEQTGYQVNIVRLMGAYSNGEIWFSKNPINSGMPEFLIVFECEIIDKVSINTQPSFTAGWFSTTNLPKKMMLLQPRIIEDCISGRDGLLY